MKKRVLKILLGITLVLLVVLEGKFMLLSRDISEINPGFKTFDMQFLYSNQQFYDQLSAYTPQVFKLYEEFHRYDYVFPLVYGLFFMSWLSMTWKGKWGFIRWLPLFASVLDYSENIALDRLVGLYPVRSDWLPQLVGGISFFKLLVIGISFFLCLLGSSLLIRNKCFVTK